MAKQWRIVVVALSLIVLLLVATFSVTMKAPDHKIKHETTSKKQSGTSKSVESNATEALKTKKNKNSSAIESAAVDINSKCWETEETQTIGQCVQCSNYEKRTFLGCSQTGNIQLVYCTSSGVKTYISCPHVRWWEERKFWIFEGCMLVILVFSSFMVWYRQRQLDTIFHQKLRKQVESDTV